MKKGDFKEIDGDALFDEIARNGEYEFIDGEGASLDDDQHVFASWLGAWSRNCGKNLPRLDRDFWYDERTGRYREDLSLLSEAKRDSEDRPVYGWRGPALVLGGGPSLDAAAPLLKRWRGAVFASASVSKVCKRWGRDPDYIGAFDSGPAVTQQLTGCSWRRSKLITNPSVEPGVLDLWRWPRVRRDSVRYYLMGHPGIEWFDAVIPRMFPYVGIGVLNAGCTPNNLIECAHYMGYDPLFLLLDFGWTDMERPRSTGYERPWTYARWAREARAHMQQPRARLEITPSGPWMRVEPLKVRKGRKVWRTGDGLFTSEEHVTYKKALFGVWAKERARPTLINVSPASLIRHDEMPYAPLEEVIENGGQGYERFHLEEAEVIRRCDLVHNRHASIRHEGDDVRADQTAVRQTDAAAQPVQDGDGR